MIKLTLFSLLFIIWKSKVLLLEETNWGFLTLQAENEFYLQSSGIYVLVAKKPMIHSLILTFHPPQWYILV